MYVTLNTIMSKNGGKSNIYYLYHRPHPQV